MKIHIGCGTTLLTGFVNIDNSPSALLSKMPGFVPSLLNKLSLINGEQLHFSRTLREKKDEFRYANCLHLPFPDGSIDFAYSSHMLGWCLGQHQIDEFVRELHRVLRPGGGARLSFFDLDKVVADYQQHRNTVRLMEQMPLGAQEFTRNRKIKLLFSPNMQNGIPLNAETFGDYLRRNSFRDIQHLPAGATTMDPEWVEGLDLYQRAGASVFMECRK
ncbi:class I SAM-dependent methyltransferase [Puia sp.]|jgi:SAM-dependent methyltransferase|uniref:class I SAM-dependent methyltransferase n=1 Tax=Puia sp. TaxID=2045100 RepID=UPI002F405D4B